MVMTIGRVHVRFWCLLGLPAILVLRAFAQAPESRLVALTEAFRKENHIPGLAASITLKGRPLLMEGFGLANLEWQDRAGPDTVFEIGSMTKTFTAQAVLLLAERKQLSLDDRGAKYLPEVPEEWRSITIRQLLTHVSGLPDWESDAAFSYGRNYTPEDFIRFVAKRPLDFAPGSR